MLMPLTFEIFTPLTNAAPPSMMVSLIPDANPKAFSVVLASSSNTLSLFPIIFYAAHILQPLFAKHSAKSVLNISLSKYYFSFFELMLLISFCFHITKDSEK
jgi:hypothetical protein